MKGKNWHLRFMSKPITAITVSKPHSTILYFSKLQHNFVKKYSSNWLSAVDIYCLIQNQKEKVNIFAIYCKKWRPKSEKWLEKWGFLFVSKPHTCCFGHLMAMEMDQTLWGGRSYQNPACWRKKLTKSPYLKSLRLWPSFWPLLLFLRLRGRNSKK